MKNDIYAIDKKQLDKVNGGEDSVVYTALPIQPVFDRAAIEYLMRNPLQQTVPQPDVLQ